MPDTVASFRSMAPGALAEALQSARNYTLGMFSAFQACGMDDAARVAPLECVNPPLWELGHLAWFAEWYLLRGADSSALDAAHRPSLLTQADAFFNSNTVSHSSRWQLDLPRPGALKTWCHEVLDRSLDQLARTVDDDAALYRFRLVLAHETMHGEALLMTMQTLGVPLPPEMAMAPTRSWAQGEIAFPGGTVQIGCNIDRGFVFDNEKNAHARKLPAFRIDSALISNAQFNEFMDDGGYQNPQYWSPAGRTWLMQQARCAPRHWQRDGQKWRCVHFGQVCLIDPLQPVRHLSLYEAQAYCVWSGRRLPTEAEWEHAAVSGHPAMRWGDLWEWTCSPFEPYPGFAPDGYREYSAPWFGSHQSVRGTSFATAAHLRSPRFRNFYLPQRDDMFIGFRTCAL